MILIALMWAIIPPGPDNFERVIKHQTSQTSQTSFYGGFELVTNIVFSFEISFGQRSIQSYQTVGIVKGNQRFSCLDNLLTVTCSAIELKHSRACLSNYSIPREIQVRPYTVYKDLEYPT